MNTFIGILAVIVAVIATVSCQPENNSKVEDAAYFKSVISDDRHRKTEVQPKSPTSKPAAGRIFRGKDVTSNKQSNFRFQVKIVTKKPKGNFGCGGAIIGRRLILTAAHCLENGISATVYFGILDQYDRQLSQQQSVTSSGWRMHKQYDDVNILNDIAVILLPKNIDLSDTVGIVELPPKTMGCPSFSGSSVIISGWGVLDDNNNAPSILQYANVRVAPGDQCEKIFYSGFQKDSMICADATNSGTCQGDSGGPMVWNHNGIEHVIGAVSYGAEKCEHSTHRVFTCVAAFIDWIKANGAGYF